MNVIRIHKFNILLLSICCITLSARAQLDDQPFLEGDETQVDLSDQESATATNESAATEPQEGEQEIDLDELEEEPKHPSGHPGSAPSDSRVIPFKFKLFFDLLTEYEFESETFQFTRDHAYVILELTATDWLSFRTDISLEPQFFELVFHFGRTAELRLGKVLIPFGQNEFHHLIGGRVDEQNLFLPTIWADYGLAFKHLVYDGDFIAFDYSAWIVNGFQETTDLTTGSFQPTRKAGSPADNNKMKGVGLRPTVQFGGLVTVGTSWYLDIWNDYERELEEGQPYIKEQYMLFYGVDIDFGYGLIPVEVLRDLRLRGEIAWGEVMLPLMNWYRGLFFHYASLREGFNIELSYRIVRWLVLRYRFGYLDADDRVKDFNDLFIHEPGLIATIGPVQFSLLLQLHDEVYNNLPPETPPPIDDSRLYARVLFRY